MSLLAAACDAAAVFLGFMLAVWIRFDSGWVPMFHEAPPRRLYVLGAAVATLIFLLIFRSLGLYHRPQLGRFTERIPRIIRAVGFGLLVATALAFAIRTNPPYSRLATALAFITVTLLVVVERNILFQLERHWAKYRAGKKRVAILGTGPLAARLRRALEEEPRLRAQVVAFFPTGQDPADPSLPADLLHPDLAAFETVAGEGRIDEAILANPSELNHADMVELILHCERSMVDFHMVPDIFRLLTAGVSMQSVAGIPLIGVGDWPLDHFLNRCLKRVEDLVGGAAGLVLTAPVIALAAVLVKASSPGPVFYRQERCGEKGGRFTLYKLRTMRENAEENSAPGWTVENDPRRTAIGSFLRRWNLDELPQFWNVLRGDMSLIGPRPERPHFVEQFKGDINRYMTRHSYKPGMSGWAQVNGLRGNTSIQERIKLDLFYLENWSLGLDLKILLLTFFSRKNAY